VSVAIVVLTHNRRHLLEQCVTNVLGRASAETSEIVIWNNASSDGTREFLDSLTDPRIRVVHHETNIAQNAYAHAFALTTAPYMIEVDDDIIDAPEDWDSILLDAFRRLPKVGYLAANLVDNPHDDTARDIYGRLAHMYRIEVVNGVRVKLGPVGGGCTMTSRAIHDEVGGFPQDKKRVFFLEAKAYIRKLRKVGYQAMYLDELKVLHAGGPHYYETTPEKRAYWESYNRGVRRENAVKRALLRIPLVRPLNNRFKLFELWQPVPLDETRRGHVESRIEDGARHWSTPE
jgi:GT2 family glycosyltransferase